MIDQFAPGPFLVSFLFCLLEYERWSADPRIMMILMHRFPVLF